MIILDANNLLAINETAPTEHARLGEQFRGKEYARVFQGYPLTSLDHTVVVFHKNNIIKKQWKDVGSGESVILCRKKYCLVEKPHPGHSRLGFDILYKVDEETGGCKNIARIDSSVAQAADHFFGTSRAALVAPTYEGSMTDDTVVSFLFGIALAHGKWQVKDDALLPIKITIPLTSSLFGRKEVVEMLVGKLHTLGYIHTIQYVQSASYEIAQLVLHDTDVLEQFVLWMKPIVNIIKISTHEKRQKVYEALLAYAQLHGDLLPIASVDEMVVITCD